MIGAISREISLHYADRISVQLDLPEAEIQGQLCIPGDREYYPYLYYQKAGNTAPQYDMGFASCEVVNTWLTAMDWATYDTTTLEPRYYARPLF